MGLELGGGKCRTCKIQDLQNPGPENGDQKIEDEQPKADIWYCIFRSYIFNP